MLVPHNFLLINSKRSIGLNLVLAEDPEWNEKNKNQLSKFH